MAPVFSWLRHLEEGLIALLMALMTLITFAQVVARYAFNYSFSWAFELTNFIFAALIFLGIAWGVRVNAHIGVDAVIKILPRRVARVIGLISGSLCLVYAALVLYGSWSYFSRIRQIGVLADDVPIPLWVPILVLPVGIALLLFRFAQVVVDIARDKRIGLTGDEAEDALKYMSEDDEGLAGGSQS